MMAVGDHETVELGLLALQCGLTLPSPDISHKGASCLQDYGTLAPDKSNVILYPTSYGAHHTDIEWLIGRQRVLDPKRYFIVIPNQFGNGLSTVAKQSDPTVTHWDNVHAQERLLRDKFGVTRLDLVYGWSMGGRDRRGWFL
jgi:homoserine O-acetyltransferase/O-succinyltransferase